MRKVALLLVLALACLLTPEAARAGKNANGALIVHTNDARAYTTVGLCARFETQDSPGTCAAALTRTDKDENTPALIWCIAAFLPTANPGVSVIYWGLDHNLPPAQGYFANFGLCGPAGSIEVPDTGWPDTGGNSVAFGAPIVGDRFFPYYFLNAFGFAGAYVGTGINPTGGYAAFVDDSNPPAQDNVTNFGQVRWGAAGFNNCPIASDCQLAVTSPNGGESWDEGTLHTLTWNSSQCGATVRIELLRDGAVCQTIASEAPSSGTYGWVAQQCNDATAGYTIRVTDTESGRSDVSNAPFSIPAAPCGVSVFTPNGGQNYAQGDPVAISWGSVGCSGSVRIDLVRDGAVCAPIAADTPDDGSFDWIAAPCGIEACGYKVRVTNLASGFADESDATFCIEPCLLTLSAPNGGETWAAGEVHAIGWTSDGCGGSVRLELVQDGQVCATIVSSTDNDGSFDWTVQQCGAETTGYAVRVTDTTSNVADESDQTFTITGCAVTVSAPNGGESWPEGTAQTITWSSSLCGTTVKLELVRLGSVCSTIAASTVNDGSHPWTVQPCGAQSAGYRVRVTDLASGVVDESNADFTIPLCAPVVGAPNGGESWPEGSAQTITWTSTHCGASVKIELLQLGSVCATIAASTPNDGSHPWTAVRCGGATSGYAIRVTDLATGRSDDSNQTFSIPVCTLGVTSPNGGESWAVGSQQTVSWTTAGCGSNVKIELLRDGSVCATIATNTPNDGSHAWTVAQCSGQFTGYQVRVTDLATQAADASDATFCIGCGTGSFSFPAGLTANVGESGFELFVQGSHNLDLRTYSVRFCFDPDVFTCAGVDLVGTGGAGAMDLDATCAGGCVEATVTYSAACPPQIPAGEGPLLRVVLNVAADAPLGPTPLDLADGGIVNAMTPCSGPAIVPQLLDGTVEIGRETFRRGDDDASGRIDILDPIRCLAYQYAEGAAPPCEDAADFDDSGRYDLTDCTGNLCYQFGSCGDPAAPNGACDVDPTADTLGCASFPPCGTAPLRNGRPGAWAGARLRLASGAWSGDTLAVIVEAGAPEPLVGFEATLVYDPALLRFVDVRPMEGRPDFLAARPAEGTGEVRLGCVPDLALLAPFGPGTRGVAQVRFASLGAGGISRAPGAGTPTSRATASGRIELTAPLFVGRELEGVLPEVEGLEIPSRGIAGAGPSIRAANPILGRGTIVVTAGRPGPARLEVIDVHGRRVRILHDGFLAGGPHAIDWDGRNEQGTPLASGSYVLRLTVEGRTLRQKLILLR